MLKRLVLAALLLPGLAGTALSASVLLDDDFASVKVAGRRGGQTAVSPAAAYANLGDNDLFTGSTRGLRIGGVWALGYTQFDSAHLANPGDEITLALTLRYESAPGDIGGALRLGLYDSGRDPATLRPANDIATPAGGGARGYFVTLNTGGPGHTNLYRDPGNAAGGKRAVFNTSGENRIVGFSGAAFGSEPREVRFTIKRTATGLVFTGAVAGVPFSITRESLIGAPVTTAFDTFVFGAGSGAPDFELTSLKITTTGGSPAP